MVRFLLLLLLLSEVDDTVITMTTRLLKCMGLYRGTKESAG